jgi:glycosyltransferase involved in cell wall biosynthesis
MKVALLITDNREPDRRYELGTPYFGTAPEALLQGFANLPSLEVHIVSCTQQPMQSPAKLADNIFFHSLHVPKIGWLKTAYQGCIRAVRQKLREIQPEIVHGQGTERDCAISAVLSGYPNVLTIHGNMAAIARHVRARAGSFLWLTGHIENWTLPRTSGVFCNSTYTESLVRPRNPRTWAVPNALRPAFLAPVPPHPPQNPPRFINIGVVCPYKRQIELVDLFKRLHEQGRPCQMEFLGRVNENEPYGRDFLQAIHKPGASAYAIYSGFRETAPLIETMDHADGCVHFSSEEAFGLVVAEALARNLKFFGANAGGIRDIANSVEGAELFAPNNWAALERALVRWTNEGCPRPTGAAQTMAQRYHPQVVAQRHLEIYREVLKK